MTAEQLTVSHGVEVVAGKVAVSSFLKKVIAKAGENVYSGTLEELEALTKANLENYEKGVGSVAGDVRLVKVPTEGFTTTIVPITETNAASVRVRWESRVPGEEPYAKYFIYWDGPLPSAEVVKIVVYRADALAKDNDRSSDAEWEIVAILAEPQEDVPMRPSTMARNALNRTGGTFREYTNTQWAEAVEFWGKHVCLEKAPF